MSDLHNIQMLILRELLFSPQSRFTDLNIQGLSSDHFSYHVATLIKDGFVQKVGQKYSLTVKGKEFANQMDTDEALIEKQPKITVLIVGMKYVNGVMQILVQERLKEPYYGYKGFISGKIRFGEKIFETARRELKEETGLDCSEFHLKTIIRNHVLLEEDGKLLEDKIFYVVVAMEPTGDMVDTRSGKNYWVSEEEFHNIEKKYYDEERIFEYSQLLKDMQFEEGVYLVKEF